VSPVLDERHAVELAVQALYEHARQAFSPAMAGMDVAAAEARVSAWLDENPGLAAHLRHLGPGQRRQAVRRLAEELAGYGPLDSLIQDPEITDINVNRHDRVYVVRRGRSEPAGVWFWHEAHLQRIVQRIAAQAGVRLSPSHPIVDARLPDGSRVNMVLPPASVGGPALSVRKFFFRRLSMEELVKTGTMGLEMAEFLRVCVSDKVNVIVSGAPGSGKTTLLNALASCIPEHERVVTIEDTAELQLPVANWVRLEACRTGEDGREVTIRDLLRASLRMRPDRVIVGEVRGPEALEMLLAMHSGHAGSMSTMHGQGCRNTLSRLATLVKQSGIEQSTRGVRELIAESVHLVVWMRALPDGRRVVGEVHEVTGMEGDVIQTQPIFRYDQASGRHEWSGIVPTLWERARESTRMPSGLFDRLARRAAGGV
jgi:pilus assembly protein CpaF